MNIVRSQRYWYLGAQRINLSIDCHILSKYGQLSTCVDSLYVTSLEIGQHMNNFVSTFMDNFETLSHGMLSAVAKLELQPKQPKIGAILMRPTYFLYVDAFIYSFRINLVIGKRYETEREKSHHLNPQLFITSNNIE